MIAISRLLGAALAALMCSGVAAGGETTLREGTPVLLAFADGLSSRTAAEGDRVTFVLASDIKAGTETVAKSGCKVFGRVTYVKAAAAPGRSGALTIQLERLLTSVRTVPLTASKDRAGEKEVQYSRHYRLKWPLGLFRTGDDVDIRPGTVLAAFVAEDVTLSQVE